VADVKGTADATELLRSLTMLAEGRLPDFQTRSKFGLSQRAYEEQGIGFDKNGTPQASGKELLNATENILSLTYGKVAGKLKDSLGAAFGSLSDAWGTFMEKIGEIFAPTAVRIVSDITVILDKLVNNKNFMDGMKLLSDSFLMLWDTITMGDLTLFTRTLGFMLQVGQALAVIFNSILTVMAWVNSLLSKWIAGFGDSKSKELNAKGAMSGVLGGLDNKKTNNSWWNNPLDENNSRPDPSKAVGSVSKDIANNTRQTAENTRKMLDLQKFSIGGGALGQNGVYAYEYAGSTRGATNSGSANKAVRELGSFMLELMKVTSRRGI
jgi:hypothetical protein